MTTKEKRHIQTIDFLKKHVSKGARILDLGTANPLSEKIAKEGFIVSNTNGEDLDVNTSAVEKEAAYDVVTAFEIFEHLLAPFNVLSAIKTNKLVASIPLKLWFSEAYWHETDEWDRHYHEFEPRQFDWLLEKSGWKIIHSEKWTSPTGKFGIRPFLRMFTKRYYIVYCERK